MGLDMYLRGEKNLVSSDHPKKEDGFDLMKKTFELGYWRKHPNLHGFIVNNFANGKDDCQEIELDKEDLEQILQAVIENKLPHTEGFFFGTSRDEDRLPTVVILEKALWWLRQEEPGIYKSIFYQASW